MVLDEVEKEIIKKYRGGGPKKKENENNGGAIGDIFGDRYAVDSYKGEFVKKRAIIDQSL